MPADRRVWGMLWDRCGNSFPLNKTKVTLGRLPPADILVDDPRVSTVHFEICVDEETKRSSPQYNSSFNDASPSMQPYGTVYRVRDLSTNGTFVNGRRVGKGRCMRIESGDDISVVQLASTRTRKRERDDLCVTATKHFFATYSFHVTVEIHGSEMGSPPIVPTWPSATPPLNVDDSQQLQCTLSHTIQAEKAITWQWGRLIGQGAQSKVFQGINIESGQMLAVKVLKDLSTQGPPDDDSLKEDEEWVRELPTEKHNTVAFIGRDTRASSSVFDKLGMTHEQRSELRILQGLNHRKIVGFLGLGVQDGMVCCLMEFVAGGSLQRLIKNFHWFAESVVRVYAVQILLGLEYLHRSHVVHGDIKPGNILISERGQIKLADFGTGKILRHKERTESQMRHDSSPRELLGTPLWMSPEFAQSGEATLASDIWAFGCVVLEMATGYPPWSEMVEWNNPATIIFNVARAEKGPSLEHLRDDGREPSPELVDFLNAAFTIQAEHRPSASQLLQHPFVTGSPQPVRQTNAFEDHLKFLCSQTPESSSGLTAKMAELTND